MDDEQLMANLMAVYLGELSDSVATLNRDLLDLEKATNPAQREELLGNLFRAAHSLKSASKAVRVDVVAQACHSLESILDAIRKGDMQGSPALTTLILRTADRIEEVAMQLRDEQPLDGGPLESVIPLLEEAAEGKVPDQSTLEKVLRRRPDDSQPAVSEPEVTAPPAAAAPSTALADSAAEEQPEGEQKPPSPTSAKRRRSSAGTGSVRIAAEKLDALLAHSGELLVARRRVESRSTDLDDARHLVAHWHEEWRRLEANLRAVLHRKQAVQEDAAYGAAVRHADRFLELSHARFNELERQLERLVTTMTADERHLGQVCDSLEEEVLRVRMLPFAEACGQLERGVRDAALATSKQVELQVRGQDVEIDRSVLEAIKAPLLHLVRNAVDHGLETPPERAAAGKPSAGQIIVEAALRGGQVEIIVGDDGRGLNLDRIREKLGTRNIQEPQDEQELARAVFLPGFSTAPIVTDLSGRGVGLDVVQAHIESLHGSVDISFTPGAGTQFKLTVPLTLSTVRSVMVRAAGQLYALPTASVDHFVRFGDGDITTVAGREVLVKRQLNRQSQAPVPLVELARVLGVPSEPTEPADGQRLAIVLSSGPLRIGFVVDEVTNEQEITVKSLGPRVGRLRHVSGATLLPSGRIALVLNVATLLRSALAVETTGVRRAEKEVSEDRRPRLLVVDDSVTTRSLLKSILENTGYEIEVAVDGRAAMELLENTPVDVVVSDVDMPRMDGFELTEAIRTSPRMARLPVVLVTARSTDEDRARGIAVGANAYITKSGFDQSKLLETIRLML